MFLKNLIIHSGSKTIREIEFKHGLNIIIDETTEHSTDSGNNVGKTTFLRVIDYCLGGNKDAIYTDLEFKRKNQKIFDFLNQNNVIFELNLEHGDVTHKILRPFDGKSSIDNVECGSEAKFRETLQAILFGITSGRPTLSQLMNKFIRIEDQQINNALYFLFTMADESEYEALFLFLFGFRDFTSLGEKRKTVDRIKKLKKSIDESPNTIDDLNQQLALIEDELKKLEEQKAQYNFASSVAEDLSKLKELQHIITGFKDEVAKLNLKKAINQEALDKLKEAKSKVSVDAISKLYLQAKVEIPNLNKKFEELLEYHNKMIENKSKFIKKTLDQVVALLKDKNKVLNGHLEAESTILAGMSQKGALDEYDRINVKIQDASRNKGQKEGMLSILQEAQTELDSVQKRLEELNSVIGSFENEFSENLKKFNVDFSAFSEKLYGEKYYLSVKSKTNRTTANLLLDIGNMSENFGTGKKKAQISALDLAYLKFSQESKMKVPYFVLHDQVEAIFENQIETLFEVSNSVDGQFVVAVLSDKLQSLPQDQIEKNCILKLSQNNKFFKIS